MIRLAIFADVHGKLLLPFKLVDYYQKKMGQTIDAIIQCGDMGAFPHKDTMDKATLKHARNDRDELGFMDNFVRPNQKVSEFLKVLNVPMYAVWGNHECHDFLDDLEIRSNKNCPYFKIDCYGMIRVLKTGHVLSITNDKDAISLMGIGRIGDTKGRKNLSNNTKDNN